MRARTLLIPTAAALLAFSQIAGCAKDPNAGLTPREIKERYARMLLEGSAHGMSVVSAQRVDPATLELFDIRLDDGKRLLHADRAEILISAELKSVSLRLYGVVTASEETGNLVEIPGFTTDPIKIAMLDD